MFGGWVVKTLEANSHYSIHMWTNKIDGETAVKLGAGFAAAATNQQNAAMAPFNPTADKDGSITFAAAPRRTHSTNMRMFFGPNKTDPLGVAPTLTVLVEAPASDFDTPETYSGGLTPVAKDIAAIAEGVGPYGGFWPAVAGNFKKMAESADPKGGAFRAFRNMKEAALTALLRDDAEKSCNAQSTGYKSSYAPKQQVKQYIGKADDDGTQPVSIQASFTTKLFVPRTKSQTPAEHEAEVERLYHPESSLSAYASANAHMMPSRLMFCPLNGEAKAPWTTALFGPYDGKIMHGSVHFKPWKAGLSVTYERIYYTCFVDQIDVIAVVGSSGGAVATTEVNAAQMLLLNSVLVSAPVSVEVDASGDELDEPAEEEAVSGDKRKPKEKGGKARKK